MSWCLLATWKQLGKQYYKGFGNYFYILPRAVLELESSAPLLVAQMLIFDSVHIG